MSPSFNTCSECCPYPNPNPAYAGYAADLNLISSFDAYAAYAYHRYLSASCIPDPAVRQYPLFFFLVKRGLTGSHGAASGALLVVSVLPVTPSRNILK